MLPIVLREGVVVGGGRGWDYQLCFVLIIHTKMHIICMLFFVPAGHFLLLLSQNL